MKKWHALLQADQTAVLIFLGHLFDKSSEIVAATLRISVIEMDIVLWGYSVNPERSEHVLGWRGTGGARAPCGGTRSENI